MRCIWASTLLASCFILVANATTSLKTSDGFPRSYKRDATTHVPPPPTCAKPCEARFLTNETTCSYHELFRSRLNRCVQKTCPTLEDVLQWQNHFASACDLPARDEGVTEVVLMYVLFGVATVAAAGRLLSRSRFMNGPGFWWDDWLVVALWVLSIELVVCLVFLRRNGTGRDALDWVDRGNIDNVLLWVHVSVPFYLMCTFGSKLVWVLLYMRMWDANTAFRKLCWFTVSILVICMIGFGVAAIVIVWPYKYYIGRSAVVRSYRLGIDLNAAVLGIGAVNVALDFWVLLLPIPKLISLQGITIQRKIGICLAFLLGFIVTACSIYRLTTILPLKNSTNVTWDIGHFGTWSEIEAHLSMVSCNVPAIVGLVHRLIWRYRRRTRIQAEEEPQSHNTARSNVTKEGGSELDDLSTTGDKLCESSNGGVLLAQ